MLPHALLSRTVTALMAQFEDLPPEIFLQLLKELALSSLIAARGVCRGWRDIVHSSCRDIPPIRRRLLHLYLRLVQSHSFVDSRSCISPSLRSFDRKAFIVALPENTPEEFQTWILEWPARAVFDWIWPGLPASRPNQTVASNIGRQGYKNYIGKQRILEAQLASGVIPRKWLSIRDPDGRMLWQLAQPDPERPVRTVRLLILAVHSHTRELFSGLDVSSYIALMLCPAHEDGPGLVRFSIALPMNGVDGGFHASVFTGGWMDHLEAEFNRQEKEMRRRRKWRSGRPIAYSRNTFRSVLTALCRSMPVLSWLDAGVRRLCRLCAHQS